MISKSRRKIMMGGIEKEVGEGAGFGKQKYEVELG